MQVTIDEICHFLRQALKSPQHRERVWEVFLADNFFNEPHLEPEVQFVVLQEDPEKEKAAVKMNKETFKNGMLLAAEEYATPAQRKVLEQVLRKMSK